MPRKQKRKPAAPKKIHPVKGETQVIQEAQATTTEKRILRSSSTPLEVTTHADSASQSQSPPERSQREVSATEATDMPNPRSNEGTKCKSKRKHCSPQPQLSTEQSPEDALTEADMPNPRSNEGTKCKSKRKHCSPQLQHSSKQSPQDALTKAASKLVNFIIEMYKMQKPIMKKSMLKIIDKKYKKRFPELLGRASFNIEVVFGMELKKVDATKPSYALVSKMNLPYNGMLRRDRGFPKTGLLMNLLGVIFMNGHSATEEKIWEFLNKMKIYDGKRHFLFGEPRKLITKDLVKLKYLEYRRVPGSNPPQYEFLWGPRAYAETSKMKVLEFWAKINDTEPSAFESRYEEALRDEKERADAVISLSDSTEDTDSDSIPFPWEEFFL
ncbi:PREDICTED: melanoma-associated antigen B3-like [Chinchilla lanigera]|uniref:melanoma-associated antigen B3-like n=1 Tax=Chinchilla lanigera TaxID=34839 RepID=UPI00038EB8B2|nr:PREDICTED: melanoma-associated antigen B3-like [Chinchilla lanigera]XP_005410195.1 PREDICTED: melanoma-associated antigen B3-like [Chinchilla lanigera]XP_013363014.1 PREDICTED: melanoma-associated antigen B3-like [Chinchilla lanigera]